MSHSRNVFMPYLGLLLGIFLVGLHKYPHMNFKEWLLTEDPNDVIIGDTKLDWESGDTTFSLFDNFFIYANGAVDHHDIISSVEFCRESFKKCLAGEIEPKDVSDCLNNGGAGHDYPSPYPYPMPANIKTHGIPSRRAIELMLSLVESASDSFAPRITSMETVPDVIHGRMWIKSKVVSFWNDVLHIQRNKSHILDFVRAIAGQEHTFYYDVEDELLDYDAFKTGTNKPNPNFDPSKLHTMEPGPVKSTLMKGLGISPSPRDMDLPTRMRSYTGD